MGGATSLEKAALIPAVLAACTLVVLVDPQGYIARPDLALGVFCIGLFGSLLALALALRAGRPRWYRWVAAGEASAFMAAAAWLMHFLSTVPLS